MKIPTLIAATLAMGLSATAHAAMKQVPVTYTVNGKTFENILVYDDKGPANRPALLMVPDWLGINKDNIEKAKEIAGRDYVVMLADLYGKGVRPANGDEARAQTGALYKAPEEHRARINAALQSLRSQKIAKFNPQKIAALGYCFGGKSVLELARSGASLAAVASFHGGLDTLIPAKKGNINTSIAIFNGAEDKGTEKDIMPVQNELREAGADFMFVNFAGAVHCFALPHANRDGCRYHPVAAERSERMMREFFAERFNAIPEKVKP